MAPATAPQIEEEAAAANGSGEVVDQPRFDKGAWLSGATDLEEVEIDVGPPVNDTVAIRSLSAGQQAAIRDECLTMKGDTAKVDTGRMQVLTFQRGVIRPEFNAQEVEQIARKFGKAFALVVDAINEISQATEEDLAKARRRFRPRR